MANQFQIVISSSDICMSDIVTHLCYESVTRLRLAFNNKDVGICTQGGGENKEISVIFNTSVLKIG